MWVSRTKVGRLEEDLRALREETRLLRREVADFRLDYEQLYEKVRNALAKFGRRAKIDEDATPEPDPIAKARQELISRKLGRNHGVRTQ